MIVALQTLVFFRESLLTALDRLLRPYYKQLTLAFSRNGAIADDEEPEEQVFAEFDDDKGVVFYPPMYAQRYAAVSDCLMDDRWYGKLEKVVDFGYHDMSFVKYLKEVPGIHCILGVDIETIPLRCSSDLLGGDDYAPKRETPLQVILFQGNAADPDYRLIGCDAVVAIEMIEHMLPHDLDRLVHTVFGFIKPWIVIFTTPNADFNVLFKALEKNGLRRWDHLFEWTREQFHDWCSNIVVRYPQYTVTCQGIGPGPPGTLHYGCCSQLALFISKDYHKQQDLHLNSLALVTTPSPNNYSEVFEGWESENETRNENFVTPPKMLNCTTLQIKKFSKTTQNLMAKNKIDSLVHTREVVDEIRHLTKTLNFNKIAQNQHGDGGSQIWANINWGENAPYWNQYYTIVKEYNYPFETKSEEVRILDLVSEEINRMVDTQCDEEFSVDVNRLEIPLTHLMTVVQHITDDVNKVRDLLEWNGYEIINDVVIHSRLVVDTTSVVTHEEEWQDNDTVSDWDTTDVHSTTMSDGSTVVPDHHELCPKGRCLRRALDTKVRNLRAMLSADEDITTELDRVVCRLMKLALQTSRGRQSPPPTRWMQCKLLDLLTLTEKAIGRRKKHFLESYPVKALEFEVPEVKLPQNEVDQDIRVKEIVDKYRHLLQPLEKTTNTDVKISPINEIETEDDFLSTTSNEFMKGISPSLVIPQPVFSSEVFVPEQPPPKVSPLERTKAWLDEDVEVVPYPKHDVTYEQNISSGDTDHSHTNARHKHKKSGKKHKATNNKEIKESEPPLCKPSQSKSSNTKYKIKRELKNKKKSSGTRISKKVLNKKKSSYSSLFKNAGGKHSSTGYESYIVKPNKKSDEVQYKNKAAAKPIPESLIELCHPELRAEKHVKEHKVASIPDESNTVMSNHTSNISATEESCHIDIVMQDFEETIALRRTIGTDADESAEVVEKDAVETSSAEIDENLCTKHEVSTENVQSQTIFLNDINEPSTSKGIRHNLSTDVQCGPDTLAAYPMLSASTSLVRMPQVFSTGIKICDAVADVKSKGTDFGTSTQDNFNLTTISPRQRSIGIKIKDSDANLCTQTDSTITITSPVPHSDTAELTYTVSHSPQVNSLVSSPETKLLKPISSTLKIEDSGSEFCEPSIASSTKTLSYFMNVSKNTSDILIECSVSKEGQVIEKKPNVKCSRPKLCCGGIHIHSYREKQVCEDIVYQGEWQRCRPKTLARKKMYNTVTTRKVAEAHLRKKKEMLKDKKATSADKLAIKGVEKKESKTESKKTAQMRLTRLLKIKQETASHDQIRKSSLVKINKSIVKLSAKAMKIPRPVKTVTKVSSKIAMGAITSKNTKSTFTVKRPAILPNINVQKEIEKQKQKKSCIPLYLKRTPNTNKNNLNKSLDSANDAMKDEIEKIANKVAPLARSKTDEIRKDLMNFTDEVRENISYIVFRNDIHEKNESTDDQSENPKDHNKVIAKQLESVLKRSHSPSSPNSSTCSSPNSVATVRAASARSKNYSNRRHSSSSYKSSLNNSESDNNTPTKNKKVVKRCKSSKKTADSKDVDNKENVPESTKNFAPKDKEKIVKLPFVSRHKNVYIAQMKTESASTANAVPRNRAQIAKKSSIKIPTPGDNDEKRLSTSPTLSKKRSIKSDTSSAYEDCNQSQSESNGSSESANMVLVLEQPPKHEVLSGANNTLHISSAETVAVKSDNIVIAEWVQNASLHSQASSILNSMRQILEETLDIIVNPHEHTLQESKTVTLSRDDIQKLKLDKHGSPRNKAVVSTNENFNSSFLENNIENALNRTFDSVLGDESTVSLNDTRLTVTDLDLLSFKSITSVSKYSEYYLADNDFNNTSQPIEVTQAPNRNSVQDIYERKEPHPVQNAGGALAVQAFSGFSINGEPVAGDQPDSIALIDSETGSLAVDINRQATSEELFISGRSSDSYESCLIDEDAVVPNWLFQIISQQHSVEEDAEPALLAPVDAPLAEPLYDANGNVIEPAMVGVGAGAGDGRGMHSDHSQDSSGRGTSLSSSDTSSGPQSEVSAILIDPSTFTGQFELLRDSTADTLVPLEANQSSSPSHTYRIDDDNGTLIGVHDDRATLNGASDVDADISSIDTDVPDSSDN
ncbi:uncharacterized protein LOC113494504 isoform X3 [Trichoplusia ni]|uniref:Small RNA 2'-O-methyltransferase n=1 Tax=Trichoplusia ni TaxID=7111 RepID=A0A7E5VK55_TRINI|nr:uncharacterized protein LOC113494504 isoform X3 [Trichoplusia ni]